MAMSAFAFIVISIGKATALLSRQSYTTTLSTYLSSEVAHQVNRLSALTFDSLSAHAGCTTIATGQFHHTRCIGVADVASGQKRITLVITPANTMLKPDTTIFDRISAAGNPFGF